MMMSDAKTATELRADVVKELQWRFNNAGKDIDRAKTRKTTRAERAVLLTRFQLLNELLHQWQATVVEGKQYPRSEVTTNTETKDA